MRELNLDGGERSVLKALGFGGSAITGDVLYSRCTGFAEAEFIDSLQGLVLMGYVNSDASNFRTLKDIEEVGFQINSGYARDLKEAMNPQPKKKSRRVRRE